LLQKKF
jgi:hypothetical protein